MGIKQRYRNFLEGMHKRIIKILANAEIEEYLFPSQEVNMEVEENRNKRKNEEMEERDKIINDCLNNLLKRTGYLIKGFFPKRRK